MPCSSTSQLTNAPSQPLPLRRPKTDAEWARFVANLQLMATTARVAAERHGINVVPTPYAVYNAPTLPAFNITGASAALDTTVHQFGLASLKLTATASTITLAFADNPIVMQAHQRWVGSVFIRSSRIALTGTLELSTPYAAYSVDVSGTLLPTVWGRLYGVFNLVGYDPSTTCAFVLTLTGCNIGDTFNLEGWQLESVGDKTTLPSPFVNTAAPADAAVTSANATEALNAANTAQNSADVANQALTQIASDNVLSAGEKSQVDTDVSVINSEQAGIDAQATVYGITTEKTDYDNAVSALNAYLATLTTPYIWNDHGGNTTIDGPTFRANFASVYTSRQALLNAIYQAAKTETHTAADVQTGTGKAVAEPGADKTANNTAADTAAVNGVVASTVTAYAVAGNSANNMLYNIQSNGYLDLSNKRVTSFYGKGALATLNAVDLSTSQVTNKTLDYLSDGTSRFAAAQAGADKTSLNTAADTAMVGSLSPANLFNAINTAGYVRSTVNLGGIAGNPTVQSLADSVSILGGGSAGSAPPGGWGSAYGVGCPMFGELVIKYVRGKEVYVPVETIKAGDRLRLRSGEWGRVMHAIVSRAACLRVVTKYAELCSSVDGRFERMGKEGWIRAGQSLGCAIRTRINTSNRVAQIIRLDPLGIGKIMHLTLEGKEKSYLVGHVKGRMISHHNMKAAQ